MAFLSWRDMFINLPANVCVSSSQSLCLSANVLVRVNQVLDAVCRLSLSFARPLPLRMQLVWLVCRPLNNPNFEFKCWCDSFSSGAGEKCARKSICFFFLSYYLHAATCQLVYAMTDS